MLYKAFISYSHADANVARKLHSALERYRPPKSLRRSLQGSGKDWRLSPLFLDQAELGASSQLTQTITDALDQSAAMIVVCSPQAADSKWVNKEIEYFRTNRPDLPIYAFIVGGDPKLNPELDPQNAAFPEQLLIPHSKAGQNDRLEPLAADSRKESGGFKLALLKLVAGLLQVLFDDLRQREQRRRQQRWMMLSAFAAALALGFGVVAWQAIQARKDADAARNQAEIELRTEQETRSFLLSVFRLADPSEARGIDVTVREVLDNAVNRISVSEFSSPLIQAKLTSTMAQAYANLGLYEPAIDLYKSSSKLLQQKQDKEFQKQSFLNKVSLAEIHYLNGDYESSEKIIKELEIGDAATQFDRVKYFNVKGNLASYMEEDALAEDSFKEAMALIDSSGLTKSEKISQQSTSLGGLALLAHFQGETKKSESLYREAAAILIDHFGADHPDAIWAQSSHTSAAYLNGNIDAARTTWRSLLGVATKVLGERHPEIATIRASLGLLALEAGQFDVAEYELKSAIEIDREKRADNYDDLVYPVSNLGLTYLYQQDFNRAEENLLEALDLVTKSNHRWRGPMRTHLADLRCSQSGSELASTAVADSIGEFGVDDWRVHQAMLAVMMCKTAQGTSVDLEQLNLSVDKIIERWGASVSYSQRALQQALRIVTLEGNKDDIQKYQAQLISK